VTRASQQAFARFAAIDSSDMVNRTFPSSPTDTVPCTFYDGILPPRLAHTCIEDHLACVESGEVAAFAQTLGK
jgi:hypothetical protein